MKKIMDTLDTFFQTSFLVENTGADQYSKNHFNDVKNVYIDKEWFETVVYVIE